jgi:hypothetical protein
VPGGNAPGVSLDGWLNRPNETAGCQSMRLWPMAGELNVRDSGVAVRGNRCRPTRHLEGKTSAIVNSDYGTSIRGYI